MRLCTMRYSLSSSVSASHMAASNIMDAIARRNEPIQPCFFRGDAVGQHYAWLEANLVFEVARYAVNWEIPALTVHDEFIVAEENEDGMNELLYLIRTPRAMRAKRLYLVPVLPQGPSPLLLFKASQMSHP